MQPVSRAGSTVIPETYSFRAGAYVPALDGLRGIAILLVLLFHFTLYGGLAPSVLIDRVFYEVAIVGWVGVDLFFVLSGFLITGILYDAKRKASYLRNFYIRRILRIFPLYYGSLVLFCLILPRLFPMHPGLQSLRQHAVWYWTYLTNVMVARDGWSSFGAIEHFWSLAVEEQFYLAWPLVVLILGRRKLLVVCLACIVGSLAVRVGLQLADYRAAAYVLTPARLDTLAVGAWLALAVRGPNGLDHFARWAWPAAGASAAALLGIIVWRGGLPLDDLVVSTIGYTLLAVLFGAVLVLALTSFADTARGKLFTSSGLVFFGRYSYALYVFHHPVLFLKPNTFSVNEFPELMGSQLPGQLLFIVIATGALSGAALLSWHLYEKHFLKFKRLFPYRASGIDSEAELPRNGRPRPLGALPSDRC
jgi:peptidoglycan/LPS O-acetylase OafA/YrhL